MKRIEISTYDSPLGEMALGSYGERLCLCEWTRPGLDEKLLRQLTRHFHCSIAYRESNVTRNAADQLSRYFSRELRQFYLPVVFEGTEFQEKVWNALLAIPYGNTCTYAELARRMGHPRAVRAVAMACHNNPISIIVPCHRIVGSRGKLVGYAGGLRRKEELLLLEQGITWGRLL